MNLETFNKLSDREKRVAIAKDVLQRLKMKKFISRRGIYSQVCNFDIMKDENANKSAKKVLSTHKCAVCAKGALVMSWAAKFNNKTIFSVQGRSLISEINEFFPYDMRDAMECAFEGRSLSDPRSWYGIDNLLERGFEPWSLTRIMKNIVKNDGLFKVKDYYFGNL